MDQNPYRAPGNAPDAVVERRTFSIFRVVAALTVLVPVVMLFIPAPRQAREAARRTQCKNNLKQIGFALAAYHDKYETFPPAFTVDNEGRRLHSWRTLLLPFLDQEDLYAKIDLSKPWDDPVNRECLKSPGRSYSCPSSHGDNNFTQYAAIVTPESVFPPDGPTGLRDITDGSSRTLTIVEIPSSMSVLWMSPQDVDEIYVRKIDDKTKFQHAMGFHALLADGTVRWISANTSKPTLLGLITRAGGEIIGDF